jgi:hypothetical protein
MLKVQDKNPMSNADFALLVDGIPGLWTEFSGIKWAITRPKYADPLAGINLEASSGVIEYTPITIMRPFDPDSKEDIAALDFIEEKKCGKEKFPLTFRPVYRCEGTQYRGKVSWEFSGGRIKGHSLFDGMDVGSGQNVVKIMVEITYENYDRK